MHNTESPPPPPPTGAGGGGAPPHQSKIRDDHLAPQRTIRQFSASNVQIQESSTPVLQHVPRAGDSVPLGGRHQLSRQRWGLLTVNSGCTHAGKVGGCWRGGRRPGGPEGLNLRRVTRYVQHNPVLLTQGSERQGTRRTRRHGLPKASQNRQGGRQHCCWGAQSLGRPHPAAAVSKGHKARHESSGRETGTQHSEHESSSVPT